MVPSLTSDTPATAPRAVCEFQLIYAHEREAHTGGELVYERQRRLIGRHGVGMGGDISAARLASHSVAQLECAFG